MPYFESTYTPRAETLRLEDGEVRVEFYAHHTARDGFTVEVEANGAAVASLGMPGEQAMPEASVWLYGLIDAEPEPRTVAEVMARLAGAEA